MKPHNRKLVIQSIEAFSSSAAATPSTPLPPSGPPLALEPSPIPFQSPAVLVVLVILIALFAIGCFSSCLRQLSDDSSAGSSSRRRGQRTPSSRPSDNPPRSNPRKGVDSTTIRALPVYSYCGDVKYQIHCAICLGEFEENEAVKAIPFCKHVFHTVCIDTWLLSHVTCPLCRSTRFFGSVKGGDGLGAKEERCDQGVSEYGERSTVGNCDMCIEVRTMGLCDFGVRRNKSCSSLGEGARLQRTSSF